MAAAEEIVALADAGDSEGIAARLRGLDEPARRALAAELLPVARDLNRRWLEVITDEVLGRRVAGLGVALLGCGSMGELEQLEPVVMRGISQGPPAVAVAADRAAPWLAEWIERLLDGAPGTFGFSRELVRAGVIDKPRADAYVLGMLGWARHGARALLDSDPELLAEVPRLFEVEGGGELSLAAVDKYSSEEHGWSFALWSLAEEGRLSRAELLDLSLAALGRDFGAFRAGWYSRFHERLAPTLDEREVRASTYVGLIASPVQATVSFALAALTALAKAGRLTVDEDVVDALGPALRSERKGTVRRGLGLLRRADPEARPAAALAATDALAHPAADVQAEVLDFLGADPSDEVRERIRALADATAPTLRERVAALTGEGQASGGGGPDLGVLQERAAALPASWRELAGVDEALEAAAAGRLPAPLALDPYAVPALDPAAAIAPAATLDELIDVWGAVLEGAAGSDDIERGLDGLARLCAERPPDFAPRTSALSRRAARMTGEPAGALVAAWLDGGVRHPGTLYEPEQALADRMAELAPRVAAGDAHQLLAAPTHRGGWIDPRALVARAASLQRPPGRSDLLQALCRLAPEHRAEALAAATDLPGTGGAAIRAALGGPTLAGDDEALAAAVAVARGDVEVSHAFHARPGDWPPSAMVRVVPAGDGSVPALRLAAIRRPRDWIGRGEVLDPRTAEILAALWPAGAEALAGHGVQLLSLNVGGFMTVHGTPRFLELLAESADRPIGAMGHVMLAMGLAHAFPADRAAAVDAAIAGIADGRIGPDALGGTLASLMASGLALPNRMAATLTVVARESDLHAETVRLTLERALDLPGDLPRGAHAVLDLLNELAAAADAGVAHPAARAILQRQSGSSKTAKLAKALLGRDGPGQRLAAAATAAAAARVERTERWLRWRDQPLR